MMRHTYGLARVEVVGALASTLALWAVTGGLVYEAFCRIHAYVQGNAKPVDGKLMVILGCFGVLTNVAMERILGAHSHGFGGHDHGHGHGHGHGHDGHDDHACCDGDHGHNPLHGDALASYRGASGHDHEAHGHKAHGHDAAHGHDSGHDHGDCCDEDHGHSDHGHKEHDHAELGHKGHDHDCCDEDHGHKEESHGHGSSHDHGSAHAHEESKHDIEHGHTAKTPLHSSKKGYSAIPTQTPPKTKKRQLNIDAAYLHVLGDLLQNLGVILAGAVIWWRPTWQVADPLVTLFFALIVVRTTMGFMGKAVNILLEGAPANVDIVSLKKGLESVEGVGDVHDIHMWELTADRPAMSCHVVLSPGATHDEVLMRCQDVCADDFDIDHATIQVQASHCRARTCCSQSTCRPTWEGVPGKTRSAERLLWRLAPTSP